MSYEISETDIPDRQLLAIRPRSRATAWTEIGEAQITHTIFGRAKVRIVRKHDSMRRALWLMAMVVAAAAAMAAWLVWFAQESAPLQATEPAPSASANVQDNVPVAQPDVPQSAISPYAESKPQTPPQTGVVTPPITTPRVLQPVQVLKDAGQSAKRVTPDPLATGDVAARKQTDTPTRPVLPGQGMAPTVATPRSVQPAAPAAVTPPAPTAREDASTAAPAVDGQAADTGKAQP